VPHVFNVRWVILNAPDLLRVSSLGLRGIALSGREKHEQAEEIPRRAPQPILGKEYPFNWRSGLWIATSPLSGTSPATSSRSTRHAARERLLLILVLLIKVGCFSPHSSLSACHSVEIGWGRSAVAELWGPGLTFFSDPSHI
jgi:hypothetical protein